MIAKIIIVILMVISIIFMFKACFTLLDEMKGTQIKVYKEADFSKI
jgi:hypothetical protein